MKKLIVEIDDKYANVVTMSFVGATPTTPVTVAAVILKQSVTVVAIGEDGGNIALEGNFASGEEIPLEKLADAVQQLEDLRCDREDCEKGLEDEENAFSKDIAAIDTALMAIKQLIHQKTTA